MNIYTTKSLHMFLHYYMSSFSKLALIFCSSPASTSPSSPRLFGPSLFSLPAAGAGAGAEAGLRAFFCAAMVKPFTFFLLLFLVPDFAFSTLLGAA